MFSWWNTCFFFLFSSAIKVFIIFLWDMHIFVFISHPVFSNHYTVLVIDSFSSARVATPDLRPEIVLSFKYFRKKLVARSRSSLFFKISGISLQDFPPGLRNKFSHKIKTFNEKNEQPNLVVFVVKGKILYFFTSTWNVALLISPWRLSRGWMISICNPLWHSPCRQNHFLRRVWLTFIIFPSYLSCFPSICSVLSGKRIAQLYA